jgi:hypothetical protein
LIEETIRDISLAVVSASLMSRKSIVSLISGRPDILAFRLINERPDSEVMFKSSVLREIVPSIYHLYI